MGWQSNTYLKFYMEAIRCIGKELGQSPISGLGLLVKDLLKISYGGHQKHW